MKNIGASVSEVPTQEKKEAEVGRIEEEKYHMLKNEMVFYLKEAPEYQISAVGEWCIDTAGKVIGDADIYFRHILTGQRCESAWSCLIGMSEFDEHSTEKWEELCGRIEELENLEEIVCDEKRVGV